MKRTITAIKTASTILAARYPMAIRSLCRFRIGNISTPWAASPTTVINQRDAATATSMPFADTFERGSGTPRRDRTSMFPPTPITIPATNSRPTILAVVRYVFTFSAMDRPQQPGGQVASPDLEGEQEAILQPHAAASEP